MPNPYKKGDKVVCTIGNVMPSDCYNSKITAHQEYTVSNALGNYIVVLEGVKGHFSTKRFELIGRI
jgi:hypothetical protein